eukprot:gene5288-5671_t
MTRPFSSFSAGRIVDLRSDTVTKPTPVMRKVMFEAEVGDDVYGEDPTVRTLELRMAKLFNKEKALFFPSGTMSNLTAVLAWCQKRGSEVILGDKSHVHIYEQGGVSQFGSVSQHVLPNHDDGSFDLSKVETNIRPKDFYSTSSDLVALENTHNECGGRVVPLAFVDDLGRLCKKHQIPVHMDGARIWNTAAASRTSVARLTESVDSISACLSKGLGAPAGSVLIGPEKFINTALRIRKALGGGMRQIGGLAAAGLQSLDDFEAGILDDDHRRTKLLATALNKINGLSVDPTIVETNIIMLKVDLPGVDASYLCHRLKENGILALPRGHHLIRLVVHRDINDDDILQSILEFQKIILSIRK